MIQPRGKHPLMILIPAFNEEGAVGSVIKEIRSYHPDVPILVLDDCSADGTRMVAERAGAPAQLVQGRGEIDWSIFGSISSLGITAGASPSSRITTSAMSSQCPALGRSETRRHKRAAESTGRERRARGASPSLRKKQSLSLAPGFSRV